jgi:hypothetical protein
MVSTIPELLAKATLEESEWYLDGMAALSMAAHGQIWGSETMFKDVHLVETGKSVLVENGAIRFPPVSADWMWFGHETQIDVSRYEHAASSLVDSLEVLATLTSGKISVGLSGGKDSRILAAAAVKAGLSDRLEIFTGGVAESPELEIGRMACEALGVEHHPKVARPSAATAEVYWARLKSQIGRYQAQVLPFAGIGASSPHDPVIEVTGFGGELYRRGIAKQFVRKPIQNIDDAMKRWPNYHVGPDAAFVMQPEAKAKFTAWMSEWVHRMVREGYRLDSLPELFFARYRVPLCQV